MPAPATNESSAIADSLASIQNEDTDDQFLDSLAAKPAMPLFPEKDVKVSRAERGVSAAAAPTTVDDDLFSMGGGPGGSSNASAGGASGFDFGSYIADNQGSTSGGLFD
eukprot:TRINITY_DN1141_c0_g1_i2.p2 TRINITY_DN1141_c0_g1~~TRINITY_DN1141_c0_g1_i2.p2  ORF type:complete len:109 (+),score=27.88 TRINITY_DN1141_c0_g1_i2:510-836(+)